MIPDLLSILPLSLKEPVFKDSLQVSSLFITCKLVHTYRLYYQLYQIPQSLNATYFLLQDAFAKYVKDYFIGSFGTNVQTYNQKHLKNTTPGEDSADRLWWFQVCTEVAYFQVAPANDSMRSSKVDAKYYSSLHFTDSMLLISNFLSHSHVSLVAIY